MSRLKDWAEGLWNDSLKLGVDGVSGTKSLVLAEFARRSHSHPEYESGGGGEGAIIGEIRLFAGGSLPSLWVWCDGSEILRSSLLGVVIGVSFGIGDGSLTCNVPDLRGRVPIGAGQGIGLTDRVWGESFGAEEVALTESEGPEHSHTILINSTGGGTVGVRGDGTVGSAPLLSEASGSGLPHNNIQPSRVVNYIIYAGE